MEVLSSINLWCWIACKLCNRASIRSVGFPGFQLVSGLGLCFPVIGLVLSLDRASAFYLALVRPIVLESSSLGSETGPIPFPVLRPGIRIQLEIRISALLGRVIMRS